MSGISLAELLALPGGNTGRGQRVSSGASRSTQGRMRLRSLPGPAAFGLVAAAALAARGAAELPAGKCARGVKGLDRAMAAWSASDHA